MYGVEGRLIVFRLSWVVCFLLYIFLSAFGEEFSSLQASESEKCDAQECECISECRLHHSSLSQWPPSVCSTFQEKKKKERERKKGVSSDSSTNRHLFLWLLRKWLSFELNACWDNSSRRKLPWGEKRRPHMHAKGSLSSVWDLLLLRSANPSRV